MGTLFLLIVFVLAAGVYLNTVFSDSIKKSANLYCVKKSSWGWKDKCR